ncbi:hypothetical protein AB0451_24390 [Streptomyces sp. NPDC052000]|uniref:hypothetical protein n=1 Tax=Streptomyces sp. NPDC052000 TaxID=3155676 RepID=UPI00344EB6C7
MEPENTRVKVASVCLAVVGVGILVFGVIAAVAPSSGDERLMRADGVAATGMGLFSLLIALVPFRRRERWAWLVLWYYPVFWGAHLVGGLPPGKDHVHQVVFIVLSLAGLLLTVREFFLRPMTKGTGQGAS